MDTPWHQESKEASFLRSALTTEGHFMSTDDFLTWFHSRKTAHHFVVQPIPFDEMDQWYFAQDPYRLMHRSGKFFTIQGIRVKTNYGPVSEWDQPIINQPEIGILGIITQEFDGLRHFLMQAKMEPGNINTLQLSPTVQATRSNYTQVHQGKRPPYLEYFVEPGRSRILLDQLQSEQGDRFLRKRNRNMVVEVDGDIPLHEEFCWLTLGQIKQLLTIDNLVNMDSRTVLSCIPFAYPGWKHFYAHSLPKTSNHVEVFGHRLSNFAKDLFLSMLDRPPIKHTLDEVISWFTKLKTGYQVDIEHIPLNQVRRWVHTDREIYHETKQYFSVIAVSVQASNREVGSWTQPLLKHQGCGLTGFLVQKIDGPLHFLVRASLEPGTLDLIEMAATVACTDPEKRLERGNAPPFLDLFLNAPAEQIRYSSIQSEEGGRFYHFQSRYMIVELPPEVHLELPDNFIWMTLGQIIDFTKHSYFNIEARNLLSCLSLLEG